MGKQEEPETILRVAGGTPANDLAAAISHGVYDGQSITLRAIGAGAVNQAVKGVIIASSLVAPRGLVLNMRGGFQEVEMRDGPTTAIVLKVFAS
jgi:stage V sporulation protein S